MTEELSKTLRTGKINSLDCLVCLLVIFMSLTCEECSYCSDCVRTDESCQSAMGHEAIVLNEKHCMVGHEKHLTIVIWRSQNGNNENRCPINNLRALTDN